MLCLTMKEWKLIKGGHTFGQKCKMRELLAEGQAGIEVFFLEPC